MNLIDLQIQSSVSDGKYSPRELVKMAHDMRLTTISITDHDAVQGVSEAINVGRELGVEVMSGIELSVDFHGKLLHILGLGIDVEDATLNAMLAKAVQDREEGAIEMVRRLQEEGFSVTLEAVRSETHGGAIGRPHISEAVLKNPENREKLGSIRSMHEFIQAYLVEGKKTYVFREFPSAEKGIEVLHGAGGAAVWSHPAIHYAAVDAIESDLKKLIAFGVDGVEAFHPMYGEDQTEYLLGKAKEYNLVVTAGSDFHREDDGYHKKDGGGSLASYSTYGFSTIDIIPKLKERISSIRKNRDSVSRSQRV